MIGGVGLGKRPQAACTGRTQALFDARRNSPIIGAAGTTLGLIYHQTVYDLRNDHRNAVMGLLLTIAQSGVFMAFLMVYLVMGCGNRRSGAISCFICCRAS